MGLTDAQRQRIEENRLKAQARLRERRLNGQCTPHHEENGARARTSVTATGSGARTGFVSCRAGGSRLPDGRSEKGREKDAQYTGREAEGAERGSTTNCEGCDRAAEDVRIDQELLDGFGVSVCRDCKLSREEFQCIPKKEAKDTYLLPEGTIAVLKFIERDNPHHSSWNKMKLFLRREVMEYSLKRWGSESALEAERARREALKYDRSLSRTKGVFKRAKLDPESYRYVGGDPDDED